MERVKRNADWKQNVEMRRLIDDSGAGEQPLKILEEKISVLEKPEHAQVHADAGDKPSFLSMSILRLADLAPEPEIHRRRGKEERGEWRVPRAVKDVARDHEQIFSQIPSTQAPVERNDDYEENDEGERIKKHGEELKLRCCRQR